MTSTPQLETVHQPRRTGRLVALLALTLLVVGGAVAGGAYVVVTGFNPVADEYVCSQGEAPAGNACYPEGSTLPSGVHWDPFGNRPLPYNCDKHDWMRIERPVTRRGVHGTEQDCVREGTALPGRWHVVVD